MKRLQLDFHRNPSVVPWLGLLLTVIGIVAVLWVMTQLDVAKENRNQLEIREDEVALRLRQQEARRLAEQKASPVSGKVAKVTQAQLVQNEIGMGILEEVWRPEIAFTRIDIATVEQDIKLELEAKTLNDVLLLVDRLNAHPAVRNVSLARNAIKSGDPFKPAVASIEFFWKDPKADALKASNVASQVTGATR
ncbi:hypothetical protein [Chitinibacter sp. ZOR0017]|uniref:hypothetical protein n=1 Tax=Chitinibacter sp. ZOR0017 TaxID=1339254 RepID=UPI00068ABB54|nr:hypothetical protein [Chitinibacter sp. ZOR0017]